MTSYGRMSDIVLFGKASERICQAPKGSLAGGAERSTRDFVQFLLFCLAVDMFIYRRPLVAQSYSFLRRICVRQGLPDLTCAPFPCGELLVRNQ
jgi:hypothetical protein